MKPHPRDFKFRKWDVSDATTYREILDNENIWKYMDGYPGKMTEAMARDMIQLAGDSDTHEVRAVVYKGQVVGQVRLMFDADVPNVAEVSYLLGEQFQGKGLAVPMLMAYRIDGGARNMLKRMVAVIDRRNEGSIAVAKKAGFVRMNLPGFQGALAEEVGPLVIYSHYCF